MGTFYLKASLSMSKALEACKVDDIHRQGN